MNSAYRRHQHAPQRKLGYRPDRFTNVTIGAAVGSSSATVKSTDSAASLDVVSTAADATLRVKGAAGDKARVVLQEAGGKSFSLVNDGSRDKLVIEEAGVELATLDASAAGSGFATRGNLTVGGMAISGPRSATVRPWGRRLMAVTAVDGEASLRVASDTATASSRWRQARGPTPCSQRGLQQL